MFKGVFIFCVWKRRTFCTIYFMRQMGTSCNIATKSCNKKCSFVYVCMYMFSKFNKKLKMRQMLFCILLIINISKLVTVSITQSEMNSELLANILFAFIGFGFCLCLCATVWTGECSSNVFFVIFNKTLS